MNRILLKSCVLAVLCGIPSVSFAYGEGEDIPHGARVIHLLTNEARADVTDALAGCGSNCPEGLSCFAETLPPLWWDNDLYRMAQFHTVLQAYLGCTCQHNSPCQISSTIGRDYPDTCDGHPACACTDGANTCNDTGTDISTRARYFTQYFQGENVAWSGNGSYDGHKSGPYKTFFQWLHEEGNTSTCTRNSSNGHRFNILSPNYVTLGVGFDIQNVYYSIWNTKYYGLYATQDFGTKAAEKPALTAGSNYLDDKSVLHFDTHYYSNVAASKVFLSLNGECIELSLTHGSDTNGSYGTTNVPEPGKCTPYMFEVQDAKGNISRFPSTGSLLYSINTTAKLCEKSWQNVSVSSCLSSTVVCTGAQHVDASGTGCEADSVSNCGVHGNDCTKLDGWANGNCNNAACVFTECQSGYHLHEGSCEEDSIGNCGQHGNNCTIQIRDWANGDCTNGSCVVTACLNDKIVSQNSCIDNNPGPQDPSCEAGNHPYNNSCEADSVEHCGSHGNSCATAIADWADGSCTNGSCIVTACANQKIVSQNQCIDSGSGDPVDPVDPVDPPTPVKPANPNDYVEAELLAQEKVSEDCSGNPVSSHRHLPLLMLLGAMGLGLARKRKV